jgi:hypothetical protein
MAEDRLEAAPRGRRIWILSLALLVLLAIGIGIAVPAAVRFAAHRAIAGLGFHDVHGGTVSLGLHRIEIANIELGRASRTSIAATFCLGQLIQGRLDTIEVSDTVLHGVVTLSGAPEFDGFATPAGSPTSGPISLPVGRVDIVGMAVELETPTGPTKLKAHGTVTGIDGGIHFAGSIELAGNDVNGTTPADFAITPAGWSLSLNPIHVAFSGGANGANAIDGHLTLAATSAAGLSGDGALKGENLTIRAVPIRALDAALAATPDGFSGNFQLAPKTGGAGINASVKSDTAGVIATLKAAFSDVGVFSKALGSTIQGSLQANLTLHAGPAAVQKPVTLDLAYDGIAPGGVLLENATLRAAGTFDSNRDALALTSCAAFSADGASLADISVNHLSGCLGPAPDGPLLARSPSGEMRLAGVFRTVKASLPGVDAAIPSLHFDARLTGSDSAVSAELGGATIDVPALGAGFHDLIVKAGMEDGAIAGTLNGNFGPSATKSPSLSAAGTLGGSLDGGLTLTATAGSLLKASVTGKSAKLDMPATELGESGADIVRLLPGLATSISKLSGTLALSLSADWSGAALTSRGTITLKDIGATTPNFTLEGLSATIGLTSLRPLSTAGDQVVTMKKLMVGVPLTDGRVTFGLDRHNKLDIADAHWSIAGGTVGTYDQQLDLYVPDQNLGVVVRAVDLAELLNLMNVSGLSAEGKVEGVIPLRRTKDIIRIEHGVLQTSAPGVLRYDPADTPSFLQGQPGEGTAILREALKDFRYQTLSLTIDGLLGGEEQIKVSLNGANPTLYGGVPVALNINLSGALDSIARSSVEAYTNPTKAVHRKLRTKPGEKK